MDTPQLLELWRASWHVGIWIAPWEKAVGDLSAQQAAWTPAADRHSIWQITHHVTLWREYTLSKCDGRPGPSRADMERDNFAVPALKSEASWQEARERLKRSHDDIEALIAQPGAPMERLPYHLGHDCYHLGQIMYLRALQSLPAIE